MELKQQQQQQQQSSKVDSIVKEIESDIKDIKIRKRRIDMQKIEVE